MVNKKKGQNTAGGAAAFIALIAGVLLLYILLVPPEVREELLDDDYTGPSNGVPPEDPVDDVEKVLLDESPGPISYLERDEYDHHLSPFDLHSTKETKSKILGHSIYVKKGVFQEKTEYVEFEMPEKELVENIYLDFELNENRNNQGSLKIWLNGVKIFDKEVGDSLTNPISISTDIIEEENNMSFEVSGVGWKFWTINEYEINELKLYYDEIDRSRQVSEQTFIVSETEIHNLDYAQVSFDVDCITEPAGLLEVRINREQVDSSSPRCTDFRRIDVSADTMKEGVNRIEFEASEGEFSISNAKVTTKMEEMAYPTYYYDAPSEFFTSDGELKEEYDVKVKFDFLDGDNRHSATVITSDGRFTFSGEREEYERKINDYVVEGENAIKIEPRQTDMDIVSLKVEVVT